MKRKQDYTAFIAVAVLLFFLVMPYILSLDVLGQPSQLQQNSNPLTDFINAIVNGFNSLLKWFFGG